MVMIIEVLLIVTKPSNITTGQRHPPPPPPPPPPLLTIITMDSHLSRPQLLGTSRSFIKSWGSVPWWKILGYPDAQEAQGAEERTSAPYFIFLCLAHSLRRAFHPTFLHNSLNFSSPPPAAHPKPDCCFSKSGSLARLGTNGCVSQSLVSIKQTPINQQQPLTKAPPRHHGNLPGLDAFDCNLILPLNLTHCSWLWGKGREGMAKRIAILQELGYRVALIFMACKSKHLQTSDWKKLRQQFHGGDWRPCHWKNNSKTRGFSARQGRMALVLASLCWC